MTQNMKNINLPAMIAFVDDIAGIIFLTTPRVRRRLTFWIPNNWALSLDFFQTHWIWSTLSGSKVSFESECSWGHKIKRTHSIQCSGSLGVWAIVHNGYKVFWGGNKSKVHSIHAEIRGKIKRACPLNPNAKKKELFQISYSSNKMGMKYKLPSVPPSMNGMIVEKIGSLVISSLSTKDITIAFIHLLASIESNPQMIQWNCL